MPYSFIDYAYLSFLDVIFGFSSNCMCEWSFVDFTFLAVENLRNMKNSLKTYGICLCPLKPFS